MKQPRVLLILLLAVASACSTSPAKKKRSETLVLKDKNKKIIFQWPMKVNRVVSFYGWRGAKRLHDGIDIAGKIGDPIYASAGGLIVHNGWLRGYGRSIIISHGNEWSTLYAHLSRSFVSQGRLVKAKQRIGSVGVSGKVTGAHLHFEIRKGSDPLDPLLFLPQSKMLPLKKGPSFYKAR